MEAITGFETREKLPAKVLQMYRAVLELMEEGADVTTLRVSTITERAGIGKGTAYEYFTSREEIVASAVIFNNKELMQALYELLECKNRFEEQLDWMQDEMSKEDGRKFCYLRTIHILTDSSDFSKLIRQKMDSESFEQYTPTFVFGNILQRAVERGELRDDLPLEYMAFLVLSHVLTYMMTITVEDSQRLESAKIKHFVRQGILTELCKKNV